MTFQDIQSALAALAQTSRALEEAYIDNGGEVTEETASLEDQKEALRELLSGEGIDVLGRWLKSKEDEKASWKAEKAAADRHIKAVERTIDFIKYTVGQVLREAGVERAKGSFYTFSQFNSVKTSCDAEAIDARWLEAATEAARNAGLPSWCDIAIKPSASRLKESLDEMNGGPDAAYLRIERTPTSTFTKPAKAKE